MFDWRDYLAFAREVVASSRGPSEASARAAASRAYYAAFHVCRELLERRRGATFGRAQLHAAVIGGLREEHDTAALGLHLDRLRARRLHADYNAAQAFQLADAEGAIELASRVIRAADRSPGESGDGGGRGRV